MSKFSGEAIEYLDLSHCQLLGDHDLMTVGKAVLLRAALALLAGARAKKAGITLVSFGDGPRYEATLAYFRRNAAHLGFTATLLWGSKDVERDLVFRANLTHLNRMGRRPYCAGFKAPICVEINQCDGCTRQFFTKSFLGDDAAVLALSSGEEPASPRHRAGVASMAWRTTRRFSTNAP